MFPRVLLAVFDIIQLLQLRGSRPKFIRTSSRPSWTTAGNGSLCSAVEIHSNMGSFRTALYVSTSQDYSR